MIMKDALQIYDDLLAAGTPQAQAHAQARAMADSRGITSEDLLKLESKIFSRLDKIDSDMLWMRVIGGFMILMFSANIAVLCWLK